MAPATISQERDPTLRHFSRARFPSVFKGSGWKFRAGGRFKYTTPRKIKSKKGTASGFGPVMQFCGVHTENGSASIAAKTMGILRYTRPTGRRKERDRGLLLR